MTKYAELRIPASAVMVVDAEIDHSDPHPVPDTVKAVDVPVTYTIKAITGNGKVLEFAERSAADEVAALRKEIEDLKRDVQDWKDEALGYKTESEDEHARAEQEKHRATVAEVSNRQLHAELEHTKHSLKRLERIEEERYRRNRPRIVGEPWHVEHGKSRLDAEMDRAIRLSRAPKFSEVLQQLQTEDPFTHGDGGLV